MGQKIFSNMLVILLPTLVGLSLLLSCFRKDPPAATEMPAAKVVVLAEKKVAPKDQELQRLIRYLGQADAVHREAWWVVANERKPLGRSIFGKAQRALSAELQIKLSNKALFSCDKYLVKRDIGSALGLPQKGEIFEKCNVKTDAVHIADFELTTKTTADIHFYPQNLGDVVGLATSILNRKVDCHLKGDEEGKLDELHCKNMAQDRGAEQSMQFMVYDYEKAGNNLIILKGQVYESLLPVRKFDAKVPMSGKIEVTEVQTEAPEVIAAPVAPVTPPAAPAGRAEDNNDNGNNSRQTNMPADGIPTAVERHRGDLPRGPKPQPIRAEVHEEQGGPQPAAPQDRAAQNPPHSADEVPGMSGEAVSGETLDPNAVQAPHTGPVVPPAGEEPSLQTPEAGVVQGGGVSGEAAAAPTAEPVVVPVPAAGESPETEAPENTQTPDPTAAPAPVQLPSAR